MCGIAGIVTVRGRAADLDHAERMAAAMAHRGPDAAGRWASRDGRVAFAHRRLAIIDLDARAAQPMVSADGLVSVVYNGEIYNHAALRRELHAAGHAFRTISSDTEVLIEGYRAWGIEGLLERLDGIFAFALHDAVADVTHLIRDRYGIKPLYLAWIDRADGAAELLFASELHGLLAHPARSPVVAWDQVARYLTFMSVPAPATMLEGVWKVPAGCRLEIAADGAATLARFHDAAARSSEVEPDRSRAAIVGAIRGRFSAVVGAQMVADVPVGVMLSGGLDSGAILAEASRHRRGLAAYTVAFVDDPVSDETALAAQTAQRYGAQHRIVRLDPQEAIDHVDAVIDAMDEPQADWVCVPLWFLAREVAASGLKVVLVGEGADELFCGYEHWRAYLDRIERWRRIVRVAGPLAAATARTLALASGARLRWRTRADFLCRAARGDRLFWGGAILCWPMVLEAIWRLPVPAQPRSLQPRWRVASAYERFPTDGSAAAGVDDWYRAIDRVRPGADPLESMIALEFRQRLPELLLMRVDKITMAHGVEARVPFLARAMVELAGSIPSAEKLNGSGTKALLREAFADLLPREVLAARKRGFGAPVERWLRGPFGSHVAREILDGPLRVGLVADTVTVLIREHATGRANHAGILWALFVLSRWLSRRGAVDR